MKRGLASLTRRKGKSFILFAVVFILGNVIAGGLAIQQATNKVETTIKKQLGGKATIGMDSKMLNKLINTDDVEGLNNLKEVNVATIESIGALPTVKSFDYSASNFISTSEFKMYKTAEEQAEDEQMETTTDEPFPNYFDYVGVNLPELMDIQSQKIKLVDGRVFNEQEIKEGTPVAIISTEVAELNKVKIGDKLVIDVSEKDYTSDPKPGEKEEAVVQKQVFELIGTYEPLIKEEKKKDSNKSIVMGMGRQDLVNYNQIYLPNKVVLENMRSFRAAMWEAFPAIKKELEEDLAEIGRTLADVDDNEFYRPTYILNNPEDSEAFKEEATALLPDKINKVILSTDHYDSVAGPVKNMSKMANYVIYLSVFATILIITLVVLLFLRDRKHELGIYLSLGERRGKILGQIAMEVLVISILAMTVSVFSGNVLAKHVSTALVTTQLQADEEQMAEGGMGFGGDDYELMLLTDGEIDESDVLDSYQVTITPSYIGLFYLVGTGTILLATVVPLLYILKLNPKKIMM